MQTIVYHRAAAPVKQHSFGSLRRHETTCAQRNSSHCNKPKARAEIIDPDTIAVRSYFTRFGGQLPRDSELPRPVEGVLRSVGEYH
jgi:hypothetical protein